jgi:hypothetical protein
LVSIVRPTLASVSVAPTTATECGENIASSVGCFATLAMAEDSGVTLLIPFTLEL